MKTMLMSLAAIVVLLGGGVLALIYSGTYDVAATSKDPAVVRWALHTAMERSVDRRARGIRPPAGLSLTDPKVVNIGFEHYNEMCVMCHGAPGVNPGEAHAGLNPEPPDLADAAREMTSGQLFWVIKHGIRMTGMPAWGPTHSDAKIWAMVAFVQALPGITPDGYREMKRRLTASGQQAEHAHTGDATQVPRRESAHGRQQQ
ncbi:MAG TPA: cytochrome c [Gammaproteobacteria bacterium]|nr:cytochrome c [Gammaproteobacteria bacterium]